MEAIVIYSSRTGNTKKIARSIAKNLQCLCVSFLDEIANSYDEYEFVILACYIDKGFMDDEFKEFASRIKDKNLGLLITLGASPLLSHSKECLERIKTFLETNANSVKIEFASQGAIDPDLIEKMRTMPNPVHPITPEREALWLEAASHPDEVDVQNAVKMFDKSKIEECLGRKG